MSTSSPAAWYCAEVRSTATATATTRKTATTRIFSVRQSTASPSTITGAAIAGVPTHHDDAPRAGAAMLRSVSTVAPTAAGLKMWRPCHARTYFERDATAPASAMPASAGELERRPQHEEQDVRGDQRRLDAPRQPQDALGRGIHPHAHDDEDRERRDELERVGRDEAEERQEERDDGERREREVRERGTSRRGRGARRPGSRSR